ncbi:DUF488 family protein [Pleomorphomonas sp. NRK KF1]|uniref:DUF488 domain-containing protein n=1 Tax=Pleomorphomonas sp. NRK KF1 TaxID=2943000 RepID=UPI0020447254|nr:DUF488 domain-containing protein [Pleomorphomonas sp. NRK KF1]MCM5555528.1 DUF488 domain-containing protein [Pleomorphomonas sp. NRK KF1]
MPILHTIGYEGSDIASFLETIRELGIELLIDIREVPISRKKGFSKRALATQLEACNIEYIHLRGLGDPKEGRMAARSGEYDRFRQIFSEHMKTPTAETDLSVAIALAETKVSCLLCFERDHHHCHRCLVADEMGARGDFRIVHAGVRQASFDRTRSYVCDGGSTGDLWQYAGNDIG